MTNHVTNVYDTLGRTAATADQLGKAETGTYWVISAKNRECPQFPECALRD
jgi:hypothetical protein